MAKFILKWRYFKPQTAIHRERYLKYIATREGVEKICDGMRNSPATRKQNRLIKSLIQDFGIPSACEEYERYKKNPTRQTATDLIDYFMDEQADQIASKEIYLRYIATRPNVEQIGANGLFTQYDEPINLSGVARDVANHGGVVWTTILSLTREDAQRLSYDNANAWRILLRENLDALSQAMNVKQEEFLFIMLITFKKGYCMR